MVKNLLPPAPSSVAVVVVAIFPRVSSTSNPQVGGRPTFPSPPPPPFAAMAPHPARPESPPPRITVDSHTHVLPLRLASKIRSFFESSGMTSLPAPTTCCTPSDTDSIRLCYPVDPPKLLDALLEEQVGSSAIWTLPYAHQPGMSTLLNSSIMDLSKELTEAAGGRLRVVPGLTVHPGDGEGERGGGSKPEQVLEKAVREGAKVAKLHCSVGDYSVMDPRLE